jgi:hypothetical protein
MRVHYGAYCPMCDTERVLAPKTMVYYDLFKIMNCMEARGWEKRRFWRWYIDIYNITNDSYNSLNLNYFGSDYQDNWHYEYLMEVKKLLGLPENTEDINVRISW